MTLKPIAIDTETFLLTRESPSPLNVCLTFCDGDVKGILPQGEETVSFLYDKLTDPNCLLIGHNIAYDMASLMFSYEDDYGLSGYIFEAYKSGRITDTMIRQQLFDIAIGRTFTDDKIAAYSLSRLWEQLYGQKSANAESKVLDNEDSWRLRYGELYDLPIEDWPQAAIDYAETDAYETFYIWKMQEEETGSYFRDDKFQAYAAFCLNLLSIKGMKTHPGKVVIFKNLQQRLYDELIPELSQAGLIVKNTNTGKWKKKTLPAQKLIEKACKERGLEPYLTKPSLTYPKGQIATDKKAVYWSQDPTLKKRIAFVAAEKNITTYFPILRQGYEFPITTRYNLAVTGRTTSSAPSLPLKGTNLQNQPTKGSARNCFVPRDGYLYLAADVSGAELHTFAQVCKYIVGFSDLGDALNAGVDVHLYVAAQVEDLDYDDAKLLYDSGDKDIKKSRDNGKMANFGFMGGMMPDTWSQNQLERTGLSIDPIVGRKLRKGWLRSWSEAQKYLNHNQKIMNRSRSTVFETFYSKRLTKTKTYCALCNRGFQCLAADGGKLAITEITRKCYDSTEGNILWEYDCYPVAWIHDELLLEIPDLEDLDIRQQIVDEFTSTMTNEFNKVVPDYPTTVEAVLMDCWNKEANPIYDEEGRLKVWYDAEH